MTKYGTNLIKCGLNLSQNGVMFWKNLRRQYRMRQKKVTAFDTELGTFLIPNAEKQEFKEKFESWYEVDGEMCIEAFRKLLIDDWGKYKIERVTDD